MFAIPLAAQFSPDVSLFNCLSSDDSFLLNDGSFYNPAITQTKVCLDDIFKHSFIKQSAALGENDNKRRLSCRAFNKNIPGSTIEDHWDVLVMCK